MYLFFVDLCSSPPTSVNNLVHFLLTENVKETKRLTIVMYGF